MLVEQLTHVPNAKGDLLPEVPEMEPFASSFTTDTTDILSVDGTTKLDDYEELNWGTTFAGAEGSTEDQRTAMETWSSQYHTQNAITKVHQVRRPENSFSSFSFSSLLPSHSNFHLFPSHWTRY